LAKIERREGPTRLLGERVWRLSTVALVERGGPRHSMDDPSRHPIYEIEIASVEFFVLVSLQLTFKMPYTT
jgi:hypothetical protein